MVTRRPVKAAPKSPRPSSASGAPVVSDAAPAPLATAPIGPAVAWTNARGQGDGVGGLAVTAGTAGALTGPLVALRDLRVQTDAAGALLVTSVTAGAIKIGRAHV